MIKRLYQKLFLSNIYFTIAIRKRTNGIRTDRVFCPDYIMPAKQAKWAADPMLVDCGDETYLFYEAVEQNRGHIAVSKVNEDGSLSAPNVILKDDTHYSYPFVFQKDGVWYMIPESSEAREVRLYRAAAFPEKWELCEILLQERAVDTTVFEQDGNWYLLTFLTDGLSERVTPRAYRMLFAESAVSLEPMCWEHFDSLQVRGAGPLLREGDQLLRPAQISQEQRYGDGLVFHRVTVGEDYRETPEFEMTAGNLRTKGVYADGLHTYCSSNRFEAIDIRCRDFDMLKPVKKLMRMFGK